MQKAILAEVRRRFRVNRKGAAMVDRKGAAMIEYALLGGLIAVVAVTAVSAFGTNLKVQYQSIASSV